LGDTPPGVRMTLTEEGFSKGRVAILLILIVLVLGFFWITINISDAASKAMADVYKFGGVVALIVIPLSWIIKTRQADFDVPVWSNKTAFGPMTGWTRNLYLLACLGVGFFILYNTVSGGISASIFGLPKMQVVELDEYGTALASGLAGMIEEMLLICVMFGIFYFAFYYYFPLTMKDELSSSLATVICTGLMFGVVWHVAVYGMTNVPAMMFVTFMGLLHATFIAVFRNFLMGASIHFANNFGITYVISGGTLPELVTVILTIALIIGGLYILYRLVRR
jgi:hypothetical protein